MFPKEIFKASERWAAKRFVDLRYYQRRDEGGHFAALEQPEVFVQELRNAFATM
jgi:pimeloyl-ACP methyl ester carboxylesterase